MTTIATKGRATDPVVEGIAGIQAIGQSQFTYYLGGTSDSSLYARAAQSHQWFFDDKGMTSVTVANFLWATEARRAFAEFSLLTSMQTTEADSSGSADSDIVLFGVTQFPGYYGLADMPLAGGVDNGGILKQGSSDNFQQFVLLSAEDSHMTVSPLTGGGSFGSTTVLHEIGHALAGCFCNRADDVKGDLSRARLLLLSVVAGFERHMIGSEGIDERS